jgi:sulfur carrier protein ThiS adenylyltransferase
MHSFVGLLFASNVQIVLMEGALMSLEYREILGSKKVGIAGAGGLGSNCAVALARAGVGRLTIADFDVVSKGNLDRQYFFFDQVGEKKVLALKENIRRIDSSIKVEAHDCRLDPGLVVELFADCDVVVEAFDVADAKQMIVETAAAELAGIPLVVGSGLAGYGGTKELVVRRFGSIYICGDQTSEVGPEDPPMAPRVGIVANMEANVVLEILLDGEKPGKKKNHENHTE